MQTMYERPPTYRWPRSEYERLAEAGILLGRPVELIAGEIVELSPKGPRHERLAELVRAALTAVFPAGPTYVRKEAPLALGAWGEPEPDLAVVVGGPCDYLAAHPTAAQTLLVVEIADTTASYDRGRKPDIYAAAAIADDWVVLPAARTLVVLRSPAPDPASASGHRFGEARPYQAHETVAPLAQPLSRIAVADLLP